MILISSRLRGLFVGRDLNMPKIYHDRGWKSNEDSRFSLQKRKTPKVFTLRAFIFTSQTD
jgi:hypothetical protein